MFSTAVRPSGASHTASRGSARVWIVVAVVGLAAVLAAVWFLGDVPNRLRAAHAMRDGRITLLASDLPKALGFFRQAALARPTDEAVVQQYDQTQVRWLEMVEQKLAQLDPADAYQATRQWPPTEPLLVEPHLGRFRARIGAVEDAARAVADAELAEARALAGQGDFDGAYAALERAKPLAPLAPELAARVKEVQEAYVAKAIAAAHEALADRRFSAARAALEPVAKLAAGDDEFRELKLMIDDAEVGALLDEVTALAATGDFTGATERLGRAGALKARADEVAAAQTKLHDTARQRILVELAQGIAADDRAAVSAALEQGHLYAGWPEVPPEQINEPADLPSFLKMLDTFDLGPAAMARYVNRADIPLVLACRQKFSADALEDYLREGFFAWSRTAQQNHCPGLALLLDEEARAHGAPADAAWRKSTLAAAVDSTQVQVAVADPAKDPAAPAGLNEAATAALKKALREKLTAWPKLVDYDPAKPVTVVLSGAYDGFASSDDDSDVVQKTVRYQSGTRQVFNRERQDMVDEHNDLLERRNRLQGELNDKQAFVDQVNGNPNSDAFTRSQAVDRAIEIASGRALLLQWNREINDLRARGGAMPKFVNEPVYADETYKIIKHVYTCRLTWRIDANTHGRTKSVARRSAEKQFRTEEVAGNASHGVPVRPPQRVPEAQLAAELVKPLVAQASRVDDILLQLPGLTLTAFVVFHEKSAPFVQAEQYLALTYAWEKAGRTLEAKPQIIAQARQLLGLPGPL